METGGIVRVFQEVPLRGSETDLRFGRGAGECPETEDVSDGLLRLPFYNGRTDPEQAAVVAALWGCDG